MADATDLQPTAQDRHSEAHVALQAASDWSSRARLALASAEVNGALISVRLAERALVDATAALLALSGVGR